MNGMDPVRVGVQQPATRRSAQPGPGLNRLDRYVCGLPSAAVWLAALGLVAAIAASDYLTGYDMSLAVLYLGPVFIAAWVLGLRAGILMSVLCTGAWSLSVLFMRPLVSDLLPQVWDGGIQCAMFVLFSVLISKLKAALGHSDERFTTVLEGMDASVHVCDAKTGELLYANERFRSDFPPGTEVPTLPADLRQGEFHDATRGRWHLVHSRSMRWVDGRRVRLLVATDITERKRGEAVFHRQQEKMEATARFVAVGEMASTLAHELNQPLAAVVNYSMGCVRRLRSGDWNAPELLETIEKAAAQAERAGRVVQRVRAFVARRTPNPVRCNVNDIVRSMASMLQMEAGQGGAAFTLELDEAIPDVRGDPPLLEQVVVNLARNALEAMHETPGAERRLTIRSRIDGGCVAVEVEDCGRGIDPQLEAHLFTPFYSTKEQGTGLGLHICRSIIEAHEGSLWMSRNAGRGVTFHFALAAAHG